MLFFCLKCQLYSTLLTPYTQSTGVSCLWFSDKWKTWCKLCKLLCLHVCEWWMSSYKLPKTLMTQSYIIINLTQLLSPNKFSFISEGKGKYHSGQTWLHDGWTELATWALNSSSSENSENKNVCPEMVPGQARFKLALKYEREVVQCFLQEQKLKIASGTEN